MAPFLARLVTARPRAVLALALLLAVAALPLVLRLRLDTDLVDLLPEGAPGAAAFARFTRSFAAEQALVVLVEAHAPGTAAASTLTDFADRFAVALGALPDVVDVRVRLGAGAATLFRQHLLQLVDDPELDALAARATPDALAARARRLRSLLLAPGGSALAPLLTADPLELLPLLEKRMAGGLPVDTRSGYFKSADGAALLLFVHPAHGLFDIERDRALLAAAARAARDLGATVDGAAPAGAVAVAFSGAYAYAVEYRDWLHRDMQLSTLVSAVTVLLFFALLLGALRALPVVAVPLLAGLWLSAAAAALVYGRINAVSLAFGTILLSIGIDLPIQIYNRLREELAAAPGPGSARARDVDRPAATAAIARTVERLAGPALVATLGPALVFFACALSAYRGLAELGVLAGIGLLLNLVAMLTVLPALLAVLPPRLWAPSRPVRSEGAWFAALGRLAGRHPVRVLLAVACVTAAAAPLALRVRYERELTAVEPPGMEAGRVARAIERHFGGGQKLLVALVDDADPDRALARSDAWRREAERLRASGLLASFESVSTLFPSLAEQERRRARIDALAPDRLARDLERALVDVGFDAAQFAPFLDQLRRAHAPLRLADAGADLAFLVRSHVHDEPGHRLVATFFYPAEGRLDEAIAALAAFAARDPAGGELTGTPILSASLLAVVRRDTVRVTAAAVALVVLLLAAYYRQARPVVAIIVPLAVAWALFAAALGALDLPLNLFNLVAVPLVVGYGIDDHVFLLHRHVERAGAGPERALSSTGRAIVVTSLSTVAGFGGLCVARFSGLRLLGATGALAVALCLCAAFAVLPALLALLWPSSRRGSRIADGEVSP